MSSENHVDAIMAILQSVQDQANTLQGHIDNLNNVHEQYKSSITDAEHTPNPEAEQKIQQIKDTIVTKTEHLENLMSSAFDPTKIQQRLNNIQKLNSRMEYYKNKSGK